MKQHRRALPLSLAVYVSVSVCRPHFRRPVVTLDQRDAMVRQVAVPLKAIVLSLHSHVGCSMIILCGCSSSQGQQQALATYTPPHCRRNLFSHLISYQFQDVEQADWHNLETYMSKVSRVCRKGTIHEDGAGACRLDSCQKKPQTLLMSCVSCSWAPCSSRPKASLPTH